MAKDKKDKKKEKGQTMSLSAFVGESGNQAAAADDMDWARDTAEDFEEEAQNDGQAPRKIYARTAGTINNFRDGPTHTGGRFVDYNMAPPFLGYVANLLTNLPEADVREFFSNEELKIESIKMIYKERSTFAFVEFESPQALQTALLLEGKFLKNRPIKVDIATNEQRDKMMNDKARGMLGGNAKDPKSPNTQFPDRDGMGAEQRSFTGLGTGKAPRSTTSPNAPGGFAEFSRDTMGSTQPEADGFKSRSPNSNAATAGSTGGGFPATFNFRDSEKVEQPTMERQGTGNRMPRQGSKDSLGKEKTDNWRGSKIASPNTKTEGGNWRDGPKAEQPVASWRDQPATEQPTAEKKPKEAQPKEAPKKEAAKSLVIGGEAQPQPKKEVTIPKPASAPKVPAWGSGDKSSAADRFAAFRKE